METQMRTLKKTDRLAVLAAALLALILLAVGVFAQANAFRFFGPLSRIVTPNGDARNDQAIFCFDNPSDSDVSGKVYSLLGSEVATMGPRGISQPTGMPGCASGVFANSGQFVTWDGRSNGSYVRSGIYVYRITSELKVYSGTLIVLR